MIATSKKYSAPLLLTVALLAAQVPAGDIAHAAAVKIRLAHSGSTASSWPLYVAEQKRIFEKNGIQVEAVDVRGATNVIRAVVNESAPIGRTGPDYIIGAVEKGAKIKIIAAGLDKVPYEVYARPEIKSGADLKGKTLGVGSLVGGTTVMLHEVLAKAYNLKDNDYKLLVVGTSAERYAALKNRSAHATFVAPPFTLRAAKDGFRKLASFHEQLGPLLFTTDFAHASYLRSNSAEVVQYLKSMIEATRWLYDPKNKQDAMAIHMKALKSTREGAKEDYKHLVQDFQPFSRDGLVDKASFDKVMELRAREGAYRNKKMPSAADSIDQSFLEEAVKANTK